MNTVFSHVTLHVKFLKYPFPRSYTQLSNILLNSFGISSALSLHTTDIVFQINVFRC